MASWRTADGGRGRRFEVDDGGGTVAVDIGDYKEIGTDKDGKPFERLSRFTNVWVLKEGKWQCVSGHASSVPVK